MLRLGFDTYADWRDRVLALVGADVYYVEGEGFFECGCLSGSAGLRYSASAKPALFNTTFPNATQADAISWS